MCHTVMNTCESRPQGRATVETGHRVLLPVGLLGFEKIKAYILFGRPEEAPFLWLRALEDPSLAFLVVPAAEVAPDYQPDIDPADTGLLQLTDPADALVLNVVTLRENGSATVNLKGPIVVNRQNWVAKQVVPHNAAEYSTQQPLPVAR